MASALDFRLNGPGSNLHKTLYSHSASLCPGVYMRTNEFNAGVTRQWTSIPSRGGRDTVEKPRSTREVEILLVTSCYSNWDQLPPGGPLGSYGDIFFIMQNKALKMTLLLLTGLTLIYFTGIQNGK